MESAAVFLVGIAMIWLVFWIVRNDGAATIRDQHGPFRMRPPPEPAGGGEAGAGGAAAAEGGAPRPGAR